MNPAVAHQEEIRITVQDESDVPMVRKRARDFGSAAGLSAAAVESLAIALSEVARNIVVHAGGDGYVVLRREEVGARHHVVAVASDAGRGIVDLARAMQDGYSTGTGLGLGLPSARRLVDEFRILSSPGQGTTITLVMWIPESGTQ
jgi:serine/threonine-protein kinase RsbT